MTGYDRIALVDVSPDKTFSENLSRLIGVKPRPTEVAKFKDGETNIKIGESVRGDDVFLFQSYVPPIGERFYELLNAISATQSGGDARHVTVVMPYCFGMRGERPTGPRQSTQSVVVARALESMGVDKLLTVGLHTEAVGSIMLASGVEGVKVEHLSFEPLAANYIINKAAENEYRNIVIASPDAGGTKRARTTSDIVMKNSKLTIDLAIGDKRRAHHDQTEILKIIGDVKDKPIFLTDDIGDTLGTLYGAVQALKENGAKELYLMLIHPVLGEGYERNLGKLAEDNFVKEIIFGNTIPLKAAAKKCDKVKVIPLEPFMAEAIRRIYLNKSMSELHQYGRIIELYEQSPLQTNGKNIRIGGLESKL